MAGVGQRSPGCPPKGVPRRRTPWHDYGNQWHPVRCIDIRHSGFSTYKFYPRVRGNLENCSVGPRASDKPETKPLLSTSKVLLLQPGVFLVTLAGTALVRKTIHYMISGYLTENPSNYQPSHHFIHTFNRHLLLIFIYQEPGIRACEKDRKNKSVVSRVC